MDPIDAQNIATFRYSLLQREAGLRGFSEDLVRLTDNEPDGESIKQAMGRQIMAHLEEVVDLMTKLDDQCPAIYSHPELNCDWKIA